MEFTDLYDLAESNWEIAKEAKIKNDISMKSFKLERLKFIYALKKDASENGYLSAHDIKSLEKELREI